MTQQFSPNSSFASKLVLWTGTWEKPLTCGFCLPRHVPVRFLVSVGSGVYLHQRAAPDWLVPVSWLSSDPGQRKLGLCPGWFSSSPHVTRSGLTLQCWYMLCVSYCTENNSLWSVGNIKCLFLHSKHLHIKLVTKYSIELRSISFNLTKKEMMRNN